jgi:hypothetical protein
MPLSQIFNVVIKKSAPPLTVPGFGILALFTPNATWGPELTRTYTSLAGVGGDFATTTAEWAFAEEYFGQANAPSALVVARMASKPTKISVLTVANVANNAIYSFTVWIGGVLQTVSYTSGGSATNDAIVAGLATAFAALAAPAPNATATQTGSVGTKALTITGNAAGNYFAIGINDLNTLGMIDNTADTGSTLAADLVAAANENSAWYGIGLLFKGQAMPLSAAAFAEANVKYYECALSDTLIPTQAFSSSSDVAHALVIATRAKTGIFYHPRDYEFPEAATTGRWFPITPGGDNWIYKSLSGVTPGMGPTNKAYTATQIVNLTAKNCRYYDQIVSGTPIVLGAGKVADGEFIDAVRFYDFEIADVGTRLVQAEIDNEKIPYDDDGLTIIQGCLIESLNRGIATGGIAPTAPRPTVQLVSVEDTDVEDIAARQYNGASMTFRLAGAINTGTVTLTVVQ